MSFTRSIRVVAPFAVATLTLGMTACGGEDPESAPSVTVTASEEETPIGEPTMESEAPTKTTSDPMVEESETSVEEDRTSPNDESGVIDVTVTGDEGIVALQHSGSSPSGNASPASGKLIVGPGGCFSIVDRGEPQLVIFPEDATFVLQEGKPSATIDGNEYLVGRQLSVETTVVEKNNVAGIPQRCLDVSADSVIVVN